MIKNFKLALMLFILLSSLFIVGTFNVSASSHTLYYVGVEDFGYQVYMDKYDTGIFVWACVTQGLKIAQTTDNENFTILDTITYGSGYECNAVATDGTYVYAVMDKTGANNYLTAYSVNETYQLTFIDDVISQPTSSDKVREMDIDLNGYIHVSSFGGGLRAFSFNGTALTYLDSLYDTDDGIGVDVNTETNDIAWIHYNGVNVNLKVVTFNGTDYTEQTSRDVLASDSCIIYSPNWLEGTDDLYIAGSDYDTNGMWIYEYDSTISLIDSFDNATGDDSRYNVDFYDGTHWNIYNGCDDEGLAYNIWNLASGDTFISQLDNGSDYAYWNMLMDLGTGYLYVNAYTYGTYVYNMGYSVDTCPTATPTPANKTTNASVNLGSYQVLINDIDGNTTSGTIELSSGQSTTWYNANNGIRSVSLPTLDYNSNYTVWVNYSSDDNPENCSFNETFWFRTVPTNYTTGTWKENLVRSGADCGIAFYSHVMGYKWVGGLFGGGDYHDVDYPDDYLYPLSEDVYGGKYVEIEGKQKINGTIHIVDLYVSEFQLSMSEDLNDYRLSVNGQSWGSPDYLRHNVLFGRHYFEWISDSGRQVINDYPLFEFGTSAYYENYQNDGDIWWYLAFNDGECGFTAGKHDTYTDWGDGLFNGVPMTNIYKNSNHYSMPYHPVTPYFTFWYNLSSEQSNEVDNETLQDYIDKYGDFFLEFESSQECYYFEGEKPTLIYNLSDDKLNYGNSYQYNIYNVNTNQIEYTSAIRIIGDGGSGWIYPDFEFPTEGYYQIKLFNLTNDSEGNTAQYRMVYDSDVIHVCVDDGSHDELPDGETVFEGVDIAGLFDLYFVWYYQFLIGLILILFGFICIAVISKKYDLQNMPTVVYFMGGLCGFIMAVYWELFDFWMVIILVFVFTVLIVWNVFGHFGNFAETIAKPFRSLRDSTPKEEKVKRTRQTKLFNGNKEKAKRK